MRLTDNEITTIFFLVDEFYKQFEKTTKEHSLGNKPKRKPKMTPSEVITLMILFHSSNYRNMKHFYLSEVKLHLNHLFPRTVSYNRFVELMQSVTVPLCLFLKTCCLGSSTGIAFVDSTPIRVCKNKRISRNKVFKDIATTGKSSIGYFHGFKLHIIINDKGELINFVITQANVDDRTPLKDGNFLEKIKGKLFGDKGYISSKLFHSLFTDGIHLITNIKSNMKNSLMSLKDKILLRKRAVIETVFDELKNICQIEHSRHRSFTNFITNLISGLIAYSFFPKKPAIKYKTNLSNQLALLL